MLSVIDVPETGATSCEIYVDGGARPNPGKGSWGYWGTDSNGDEYDALGYVGDNVTNNRAELQGYLEVLKTAIHMRWKKLEVVFDSKYVMKGSDVGLRTWSRNGWLKKDGNQIVNQDQWEECHTLQQELRAEGVTIDRRWVKSHSGVVGNERADKNATKALLAGEHNVRTAKLTITPSDKVTVKLKPSRYNKLLSGKSLVFSTHMDRVTDDGYHIYTMNSYSGSDPLGELIGLDTVDTHYGVILTKEPVKPLEAVVEFQNKITPSDYANPVRVLMANVIRPVNWHELTDNGAIHLTHKRLSISTLSAEPITTYLRPPRNAYTALSKLSNMLDRLNMLRTGKACNMRAHDITDYFYTRGKKNVLKITDNLTKSAVHVKHTYTYEDKAIDVTVPLTLGIELPARNNFSSIGKDTKDIKIELLTYDEVEMGFRYMVMITTDTDYALYSSSANLKMV